MRSRQRFTHFASYGSAAPTFGRAKLNLIAWHNRPKVGATRDDPILVAIVTTLSKQLLWIFSVRYHSASNKLAAQP